MAASTDIDGNFRILEVPVGRYTLEVTYIGYSPAVLPEVLAGSGKEVVLTIELTELVNKLDEVVIKSHVNKDKPLNNMAAVSARSFNVEETRRYAGGIDDPARLAISRTTLSWFVVMRPKPSYGVSKELTFPIRTTFREGM